MAKLKPKKDTKTFPSFPQGEHGEHKKPDGLYYIQRPDRKLPFVARWREPNGTLRSQAFATEKERQDFGERWGTLRGNWGKAAPIVSPAQSAKWSAFAEMTGDADPIEVARFWLEHRKKRDGEMLVSDASAKFIEAHAARGLSRDAHSHVKLHLGRLLAVIGTKRLGEITPENIRTTAAELKDPETGAPLEPYTTRHHVRTWRYFFAFCVRERWLNASPAEAIELPKVESEDVQVLTVEDAAKLFAANRDALCVGRLALEAFGGLRFSSASRISRAEIIDAEKGIVMPGAKHKSGRRHYVDGYPENLWKWLGVAPVACWSIHPRQYLDLKAEAFERAGVRNPGNVLRHSFCTYHVAQYKDAARTAVLLTHRSPSMLYQHYKGRATEADGKRYFAIVP